MLNAGAEVAYYIQAYDKNVLHAFSLVISNIPEDIPVICESPSLVRYIKPGMLFLTDNREVKYGKDITVLLSRADRVFYPLAEKADIGTLNFSGGSWIFG